MERRAFVDVYADHTWRVYAYLVYRIGDAAAAEDLTQTTFEKALRAWSRYDSARASEQTWLLSIASNVLIDHIRRERRSPWEPLEGAPEPRVDGPEVGFAANDALHAALTTLAPRDREVVALRYGADLAGGEISGLTGLSVANVHQILSRSLRRLRVVLAEGESEGVTAPATAHRSS